jgi:hypothetical protein
MIAVIDVIKGIAEVAQSLLGLQDKLTAGRRQRREDMAALFSAISACLESVSAEMRKGNVPHGRCYELETYARRLPDAIREEVGGAEANRLGTTLLSAHAVERLAMEINEVTETGGKEACLKDIEKASGEFRAIANICAFKELKR